MLEQSSYVRYGKISWIMECVSMVEYEMCIYNVWVVCAEGTTFKRMNRKDLNVHIDLLQATVLEKIMFGWWLF